MQQLNWDTIFLSNSLKEWGIALLILVIGSIFLQVISKPLVSWLYKLFARFEKENHLEQFLQILLKPIRLTFILLVLLTAIQSLNFPEVFDFEIWNYHFSQILSTLSQIALIIAISWIVLRVAKYFFLIAAEKAALTETKQDDQLILFLRDGVRIAIIIVSGMLILKAFGVNITALLAGAGIAGLAVAFAAKDSLENFIASFVIFIEKPFKIGDFISINGVTGSIESIGFRSTRLRTVEKTFVTIPNRSFISTNVDNLTNRSQRKVSFTVGLIYETEQQNLRSIIGDIKDAILNSNFTTADSEVHLYAFGDSSLDIRVTYFLNDIGWEKYLESRQEINFRIIEIVKKHESDFAYPTRRLLNS